MSIVSERSEWFTGPWIESVVRYRWFLAAARSPARICDFGCGNGSGLLGAMSLVQGASGWWPQEVVLVDGDEPSLAEAESALMRLSEQLGCPPPATVAVVADLGDPGDVERVFRQIGSQAQAVSAFEVVEHLDDPMPLVRALAASATPTSAAAISVPYDQFFMPLNDYHVRMPSPEYVRELRSILGPQWRETRQYRLFGSVVSEAGAPGDSAGQQRVTAELVGAVDQVPVMSHMLIHVGLAELEGRVVAGFGSADDVAAHAFAVQREADLAYFRAKAQGQP